MATKNLNLASIEVGEHEQRFGLDDEEIIDLAASIKSEGLIQPLIVTPKGDRYKLIAGHRRFAAMARAQIFECECKIITADEAKAASITFAENFFRTDLSPVELAVAIAKEYESGRMNIEQLAKGFHRSADWVKRYIAVTQWPDDCLEIIHSGKVSLAAAGNLAPIEDPVYRKFLCRTAKESGASARSTSAWLQAWRANRPAEEAIQAQPDSPTGSVVPLSPQSPCLICGVVHKMDALCYVPICPGCIEIVRDSGKTPQADIPQEQRGPVQ